MRNRTRTPAFKAYTALVATASVAVLVGTRAWEQVAARPLESLLWIGLVSAGGLLTVPFIPRRRTDASLSAPVAVATAVLLGPPLALIVNGIALQSRRELSRGVSGWARVFNHAQAGLSACCAAAAADLILNLSHRWAFLLAAVAAAVVNYFVNAVFIGIALTTNDESLPTREGLRAAAQPVEGFAWDFAIVTLLGVLLIATYEAVGVVSLGLIILPMWLGCRLLRQLRETADHAEALTYRVRDLEVLERLNQDLHSARYEEHACRITADVLGEAFGGVIECDPNGEISDGLNAVPVPDSEAVLGVDPDGSDEVVTVTQLAAGTLATVLRRLAAEYEIERLLFRQQGLADRILVENIGREASIADTLEDDMLQHLAAGLMQLGNARACLRLGHQERADQLAGISEDLLDNAIGRGREAVAALRDATHLGDDQNNVIALDVGALLTRLVDDTSIATALRCTLTLPDPPPKLPPLLTIAAVQIANGCLTAAAQTGAVQAHLQLGINGHLILEVRADPGGFQQPPRAIINRVQLAGGTVTVHLDADSGDLLRALIPLVGPVQKAYA